jgi:hypothetical protein
LGVVFSTVAAFVSLLTYIIDKLINLLVLLLVLGAIVSVARNVLGCCCRRKAGSKMQKNYGFCRGEVCYRLSLLFGGGTISGAALL